MRGEVALAETAKNLSEADGLWPLPEGWCWVELAEIVNIHDHQRRPVKAADRKKRIANKAPEQLFPYYGATGKVGLIDGFLFDFPSILLGEDGAPFLDRQRNKAYSVAGKYWVNNHAHILTPKEPTLDGWLLHALNFIDYEPYVGGTTRLKLTKGDLERIPIPLAPLAEQERIVSRIEALFAEITEGEAALTAARKGLDTFRRALLKAAVTGELTKDWRAANKVTETGHDLLARIAKARNGRKISKKNTRRAAETSSLELDALPELPNGWAWTTLGELAWSSSYGTSVKCSADASGVAVLRIPNIRSGAITNTDLKYATSDLELAPDDLVAPGDLLVIRTNGSETLIGRGGVCFAEIGQPTYFASYLIRFRLLGGDLIWRWVSNFFGSPVVRQWMSSRIARP